MTPSHPAPLPASPPPRVRGHERPIRAVALVLLLVGLGLGAAYVVSERVDPVYQDSRERWNQLMAEAATVEAVSFGNSQGRSINFETLGLDGLPAWNLRGDYHETLHLIRSSRPKLTNLDYVFVTISTFAYDNTASHDLADRRKLAYVTTGNYKPIAGDWGVALQAFLAPVVRHDNWEGVVLKLVTGRYGPPRASRDSLEAGETRVMKPDALERYAARRTRQHGDFERGSLARDPDLCAHAREALREIVKVSVPAHLVFFTSPHSPAHRRHDDESLGCDLDRFATSLAAASPNVSYFDDFIMESFTDESGYFSDADHLNKVGVKVYSGRMAARLGLPRPSPGAALAP